MIQWSLVVSSKYKTNNYLVGYLNMMGKWLLKASYCVLCLFFFLYEACINAAASSVLSLRNFLQHQLICKTLNTRFNNAAIWCTDLLFHWQRGCLALWQIPQNLGCILNKLFVAGCISQWSPDFIWRLSLVHNRQQVCATTL